MNNKIVTEGFTQALFFSGSVSVPKFLLDHYCQLGIDAQEIMLLIHLMAEVEDGKDIPAILKNISTKMNISLEELNRLIKQLEDKKLCSLEKTDSPINRSVINFGGLLDQLFEIWGIDQFKQMEASENKESDNAILPSLEQITEIFEQELGRPLTVFECEHIEKWKIASFSDELILEALRRGVSAGIRNFRYLDSILREWEKKGIKTKQEVEIEDQNFYERQQKKEKDTKKRTVKKTYEKKDKYNNIYL